ncbi:aldose 1-epimerase [Flagellimonas sp. CMM7]|uniref:aldose 1-epimerase n=1 Tax=Flagellimonas sp. CMM7 TaxID=2654676 RepID=UPI0013D41C19|nr:aldose 1-epimerase [Flagellimonas sp. CMM7]UII78572.1 aldose 1-epimerase [Flagellimonas sp. CMM7]
MVHLKKENCTAGIDKGELVSFIAEEHEFIHQKGSPGWRSADTEMFPIIGPLNEIDFRVQVPRGNGAIQDQHGLLRELEYELISQTETSAVFRKEYEMGTRVRNSKFPKKSNKEWLFWPYTFAFEKSFELKKDNLEITFTISGERDMPFMLGYHPAFKLHIANPVILADSKEITLDEVLAVGSRALQVENCKSITLKDKKDITIKTEGFKHFMCWTEVRNMVCIEPITFYPYAVAQRELHTGFDYIKHGDSIFSVKLFV